MKKEDLEAKTIDHFQIQAYTGEVYLLILTNQWRAASRGLLALLLTGTLLAGNARPSFASPDKQHEQHATLIGHGHRIILIDAGHGGIDGGTSHGDILEKDLTLAISRKLFLLLRADGFDAVLNRFGDYAPSEENQWLRSRSRHLRDLAQRKELAETLPAAVVVSVHINWAPSPSKHGPIVLYRQEGRSYMLAKAIQDQLNVLYGVDFDMRSGKPFYLLNKITAPTVIVEAGFISSPLDRAMLTTSKGQEKIAEAISNGIAVYLMEM
ncbi:N-acetylmuramoyl-L-alanine amidase [Paenibacillus forsythiae]|uniref:N-acetylmuramoyl-L-alanine amidase n=1 Tax=Paenibacillus forsythiae TaxID=365616 RepID=A0ABU3H4W6_9BACL|nr:N-acetylmuramoyl-L-alanine amidase [Paenibacillus forsythiae]MDT3425863.1 N-acetylmuramoyl-L-alanine amidase [Paenibacillus forsythiae]